jgi:hypothetical protein
MHSASHYTPAAGQQVEDQHHQRHNEQQVDQTTGDMEAKTQKPQNHNDRENHPKHIRLLSAHRDTRDLRFLLGCPRAFRTNYSFAAWATACACAPLTAFRNGSAAAGAAA